MEKEKVEATVRTIKQSFRLLMNGVTAQSMRDKGVQYKLNWGASLLHLREMAAEYEKDYDLAIALWKEPIRECKILAGLLQPVDTFLPEIADIWIDTMPTVEIAELTSMNLFQHLPYAPAKAFRWIADERELAQVCGFLTIARLLQKKGDMEDRVANEFLDQAVSCFLAGSYAVRNAVSAALRRFMEHSEEHAFRACRCVDGMKDSSSEGERLLYEVVSAVVE